MTLSPGWRPAQRRRTARHDRVDDGRNEGPSIGRRRPRVDDEREDRVHGHAGQQDEQPGRQRLGLEPAMRRDRLRPEGDHRLGIPVLAALRITRVIVDRAAGGVRARGRQRVLRVLAAALQQGHRLVLARCHAHEAAEGQRREHVLGLADALLQQRGTEADREAGRIDAHELRGDEMSELVDEHDEPEDEDRGDVGQHAGKLAPERHRPHGRHRGGRQLSKRARTCRACRGVRIEQRLTRARGRAAVRRQRALDRPRDVVEADASLEEQRHGLLVRGVEDRRCRTAAAGLRPCPVRAWGSRRSERARSSGGPTRPDRRAAPRRRPRDADASARRGSAAPSSARPSAPARCRRTNSTKECTTLCGCTTTSMRS